jgi:hypothetical protein
MPVSIFVGRQRKSAKKDTAIWVSCRIVYVWMYGYMMIHACRTMSIMYDTIALYRLHIHLHTLSFCMCIYTEQQLDTHIYLSDLCTLLERT